MRTIANSSMYQSSIYPLRYVIFLALIFVGPSLGVLQLKGFHIAVGVLALIGFLYSCKVDGIDLLKARLLMLLSSFIGVWLVIHVLQGAISARYIAYLFYFIFTFLCFYFSFRALVTLNNVTVFWLIQAFIYFDAALVLVELLLNVSFLSFYPLSGSEYQVGSAFWANVNTNAAVLILLNTSLYFLGFKKAFNVNSILIMLLSLSIDAKLCFLAAGAQLVLSQLLSSALARFLFIFCVSILIPVLIIIFHAELMYVLAALNQALELVFDTEALEAIVSSGNMFSVAIRAYALSEMFSVLSDFSFVNWLFGIGFGNLNISFVNNSWGGLVEHFSPHLFYLEVIIYAGLSFYIFYLSALTMLSKRFPWRSLLIASPTLGVIIAISSAVYFIPLYFFLASIAYWEYSNQQESLNDN